MKKALFILFFVFSFKVNAVYDSRLHGIAMHGELKYGVGFTHFDYVNPYAIKGGEVKFHALGQGFDTFNPFTMRGNASAGAGIMYDTLMKSSDDEPFSMYGLIAEKIELGPGRGWIGFYINPKATFSDGKPISAEDVKFSFETLRDYGPPNFRVYFQGVIKVEVDGDRYVRFYLDRENKELPLILGELPVLAKHYWEGKDFEATTLEVPVVSGPYIVDEFDPSKFVSYKRREDYWAQGIPVNKGFYNFDIIRYDYYMDATVAMEAFKASEYDLRIETEAKKWANAYDFAKDGDKDVRLAKFHHELPTGMQGYIFNTRREIFKNKQVREALAYAFDFQWMNEHLFYGEYKRTDSYFENSDLSGSNALPSDEEMNILSRFSSNLDRRVFTEIYTPPSTKKSSLRRNILKGLELLEEAGWEIDLASKMLEKNGREFEFEILINAATASAWERITLPFIKNLEKMGVKASIKKVDNLQYKNLVKNFDYDMIIGVLPQSLSPGNEQHYYFGSKAASKKGSRNYAGVKSRAVDKLIDGIVSASDRRELINYTKCLDRVLLFGHYVIPHWHIDYIRVAYWDKFRMPKYTPMKGVDFMTWWAK